MNLDRIKWDLCREDEVWPEMFSGNFSLWVISLFRAVYFRKKLVELHKLCTTKVILTCWQNFVTYCYMRRNVFAFEMSIHGVCRQYSHPCAADGLPDGNAAIFKSTKINHFTSFRFTSLHVFVIFLCVNETCKEQYCSLKF